MHLVIVIILNIIIYYVYIMIIMCSSKNNGRQLYEVCTKQLYSAELVVFFKKSEVDL